MSSLPVLRNSEDKDGTDPYPCADDDTDGLSIVSEHGSCVGVVSVQNTWVMLCTATNLRILLLILVTNIWIDIACILLMDSDYI